MKKISKLMITIFILLNTACGINKVNNKMIDTNAIKAEGSGVCEQTASLDENGNVTKDIENTSDSTVVTNNNNNKSTNYSNDQSNNKDKKSTNYSNEQSNNEAKNNDKSQTVEPDEQMINVNITIDCKTILDNLDDLKSGYKDYVPKNGIILNNVSLKIKKDSTVLDVLKTVNQKYDLNLKTRKSSYGTYIYGIGNIEEKICGSTSGWMYSVNGIFPGQSASSYRLNDNDKIKWCFTCKPGDLN